PIGPLPDGSGAFGEDTNQCRIPDGSQRNDWRSTDAMNGVLLELYRHKTWATLRLIEHCQGLDDKHLDATIPGTFGPIRDTLHHLVRSEEGYFFTVTGER